MLLYKLFPFWNPFTSKSSAVFKFVVVYTEPTFKSYTFCCFAGTAYNAITVTLKFLNFLILNLSADI